MEEEELIKIRFSQEIEALDMSKNAIAKRVGFSAQTFTNVASGRNLPGVLLLREIKKAFPSFDTNYIINGVRQNEESDLLKKLRVDLDKKDETIQALTRYANSIQLKTNFPRGAIKHPQSPFDGIKDQYERIIMTDVPQQAQEMMSASWSRVSIK